MGGTEKVEVEYFRAGDELGEVTYLHYLHIIYKISVSGSSR